MIVERNVEQRRIQCRDGAEEIDVMMFDDFPETFDDAVASVTLRCAEHDMGAARRQEAGHHRGIDVKERQAAKVVLPGPILSPKNRAALHAFATSLPWLRIAIFGNPVVPPVQK